MQTKLALIYRTLGKDLPYFQIKQVPDTKPSVYEIELHSERLPMSQEPSWVWDKAMIQLRREGFQIMLMTPRKVLVS